MKVTSGGVWRRGVGAVERSGIGCGAVEGLGRVRRVGMGDKCVCEGCVCVQIYFAGMPPMLNNDRKVYKLMFSNK